jgi:hypothetical protein
MGNGCLQGFWHHINLSRIVEAVDVFEDRHLDHPPVFSRPETDFIDLPHLC